MSHYSIGRKRAAVEIFRSVKRLRTEHGARWLEPISLSSVAAGGASRRQIYTWLKSDLSEEALDTDQETRGRPRALKEDQESLLVGFAVSSRSSLQPVSLSNLKQFCHSYINMTLSLPTLSRIMSNHNLSSQRSMRRNSRMVSEQVVEDAISAIEEIRSYNYPPHRIICMDETGLWSNVSAPKTYHFKNWSAIPLLLQFSRFDFSSLSIPSISTSHAEHPCFARELLLSSRLGTTQLCAKPVIGTGILSLSH